MDSNGKYGPHMPQPKPMPTYGDLLAQSEWQGECLIWLGWCKPAGYGAFRRGRTNYYLHRYSWELANGVPVPDGLLVLHSCDNRRCWNSHHLRVGTHKDNTADMCSRARNRNGRESVTHCPQGHEYDDVNTMRRGRKRDCYQCARDRATRYRLAKREVSRKSM